MNKLFTFLLLLIFTSTFYQCKKDDVDPIVIINVETEYLVDFKEILCAEGDSLSIIVKSTDGYDCQDLQINNQFSFNPDTRIISLLINGVDLPSNCMSGENQPTLQHSVHNLEFKTYDLNLNLNSKLFNTEKITHLPERYFISFPDENGVKIMHNDIKKIPKDLVWGRINVSSSLDSSYVDIFEDNLLNSSGSSIGTSYLADGYYSYFDIEDNLVLMVDPPTNIYQHQKQVKFIVSNFTSFDAMIENIRAEYGNLVLLELYSGKGDIL